MIWDFTIPSSCVYTESIYMQEGKFWKDVEPGTYGEPDKAPQAIRGLESNYVVFDDFHSPPEYFKEREYIYYWNDGIAAPSSLSVNMNTYHNPFPYLEMCGT